MYTLSHKLYHTRNMRFHSPKWTLYTKHHRANHRHTVLFTVIIYHFILNTCICLWKVQHNVNPGNRIHILCSSIIYNTTNYPVHIAPLPNYQRIFIYTTCMYHLLISFLFCAHFNPVVPTHLLHPWLVSPYSVNFVDGVSLPSLPIHITSWISFSAYILLSPYICRRPFATTLPKSSSQSCVDGNAFSCWRACSITLSLSSNTRAFLVGLFLADDTGDCSRIQVLSVRLQEVGPVEALGESCSSRRRGSV